MFHSLRLTILVDLVFAALVPMGIAMLLGALETRRELERASEQNARLLARVTASRLDQLVYDTQRVVKIVALDPTIRTFCDSPDRRDALRAEVNYILQGVIDANADYGQIFINDTNGIGIASTELGNIGQDLRFREYFHIARAGKPNVSHWLVARSTGRSGVCFAAPIWSGRDVVGTVTCRLEGSRIRRAIEEVQMGTGGYAVLVEDKTGIILAHPRPEFELKTLGRLSAERVKEINPKLRFGLETLGSLELSRLQDAIEAQDRDAAIDFQMPESMRRGTPPAWVAAMAHTSEQDWIVMVLQPRKEFVEAAWNTVERQMAIAIFIAVLGVLLSLWRARTVVRPLLKLTAAAKQLASGDFSARADVRSRDEVGQLADTFNRMVPQLAERMELQKSLEIAERVQQSLLPDAPPPLHRLQIASRSRYCDATGGDYFDFAEAVGMPQGHAIIAVGDVTGHGLGAALVMCTARASLRTAAAEGGTLGAMLGRVNHCLAQNVIEDMYMTMSIMHIDPDAGTLRYASAAHESIVVIDPHTREATELAEGSLPLGAVDGRAYQEYAYDRIGAGTVVFLGTDGIWEAEDDNDQRFTRARLLATLSANAHLPPQQIGEAIERELALFLHGREIQDDITYVIVKVLPE